MKPTRTLTWVCGTTAAGCLAAGYSLAGWWQVIPAVVLLALAGGLARRWLSDWLPTLALTVYVAAAAVGVLAGLSPYWMIPGCAAALAAWDLAQTLPAENVPEKSPLAVERQHLRALAAVVSLGLLLVFLGLLLPVRLPLGILVALVLLALFGLIQTARFLKQKTGSDKNL